MGKIREGYWATHDLIKHSVDRDVNDFIGWKKLTDLVNKVADVDFTASLVTIFGFKVAGRITETLRLKREMFTILKDEVRVDNYIIQKRWKSIGMTIVCGRCGLENNKFEIECKKCKANLIFAGKRKHETKSLPIERHPFYISLDEPLSDLMVGFLKNKESEKGYLFPSPYKTGKPYSRVWFYQIFSQFGKSVGLDNVYPHWLRAQRLSQLANEYGFDELELKMFSGITTSQTLSKYTKKTTSYRSKMKKKYNVKEQEHLQYLNR